MRRIRSVPSPVPCLQDSLEQMLITGEKKKKRKMQNLYMLSLALPAACGATGKPVGWRGATSSPAAGTAARHNPSVLGTPAAVPQTHLHGSGFLCCEQFWLNATSSSPRGLLQPRASLWDQHITCAPANIIVSENFVKSRLFSALLQVLQQH